MSELSKFKLFLGGTAGNNDWRERFTATLEAEGVDRSLVFNPVVPDWNEEAQRREDEVKQNAPIVLYYIADPQQEGNPISAYSIFEAQAALYDDPGRALVVFDNTGLSGHPLKQAEKIYKDLKARFPNAPIYQDTLEAVRWITSRTVNFV